MSRTGPPAGRALTTTQAAAFLGVSERTLRRYLALGLLSYGRLPGGHYRLREETLEEFLAQRGSNDPSYRRQRSRVSRQRPGSSPDAWRVQAGGRGIVVAEYDLSPASLGALRERHS
jgi:excisionase family DNA binding protein